MKAFYSFVLLLLYTSLGVVHAQQIERVEPPHWYVGMNDLSLQLMVYGENIQDYTPRFENRKVRIIDVHKVENPNYLFIDLDLSVLQKKTKTNLILENAEGRKLKWKYEFLERKANHPAFNSFDSKDAIYLITPDRFVNGNPKNDEIKGMKEGLNREAEYGRHGGDVEGILNQLDYIEDMGFTAIWLNPIVENDQSEWSYHGYATTDYYKIDPRFGSNEEYVELSKKAQEKGIGIIMDQIANHCGHQHWWMNDLPSKDWINYIDHEPKTYTNHRKFSLLDPYASPQDREIMTHGWFVETMPDLNQRNPFLKKYLIQNSIWWIEYAELYGIRQDTYSYPFREFMTDWTCAIQNEYPGFNIVGEEWVDDQGIIAYWQKGKVNQDGYTSCLRSLMDFPMNFLLAKSMKEEEAWGKGLVRLYEFLGKDYHYANPMDLVLLADNHDMSRIWEQLGYDYDLFKMSMIYLMTTRGIPQIFYGTEILMDHPGTDSHGMIRSDFPGGWKGDTKNGFTGEGLSAQQKDAQQFLKQLLNWRKNEKTIHYGKLMHFEPQKGAYVYFRYDKEKTIMLVLYKGDEDMNLSTDRFERFLGDATSLRNIQTQKETNISQGIPLNAKSGHIFEVIK